MLSAVVRTMTPVGAADAPAPANPEEMTALLTRVAAHGDRDAFNRLFVFFAPRIKSYLMRIGAAADLADDLAQEAMMRVWRKARLYDPSKASASTWIYTIARNLRIDAARRAAKPALDPEDPAFSPDGDPSPIDEVERAERDEKIRAAFAALPPTQYEVVRLHFIDDLAHSEIAERLDLPLGTVKSRLRLAFGKIRKDLEGAVE
ncbi:MAG TPA: sigma-70 family RNA polymerase sigma factor [Parvularculaceae bacterium]|nr:sigma-70 family RNA polymerase sigma factor [Parvularculaceae bacterium]